MSASYLDHFGLRQAPFGITPNPALFYNSRGHQGALDWIEDQIAARAPILTLTGEEGSGKTTLLRLVLERNDNEWIIGLVPALQPRPDSILVQARQAFGLPGQGADAGQVSRQIRRFVEMTRAHGGFAVLMVDDAQALGADSLAALAALTADDGRGGAKGGLTLLLAGQPDLPDLLDAPELRGLKLAESAHAALPPLGAGETAGYVEHRLARSGADGPIFDMGAMPILHSFGLGLPRLINVMADYCLATAAAEGVSRLDGAWVSAVLHEADASGLLNQLAEQAAAGAPQPVAPAPAAASPFAPASAAPPAGTAPGGREPPSRATGEAQQSPYLLVGPTPHAPPRRGGSGLGLWLPAAVLALAGGAGFLWSQQQQEPPPAPLAATTAPAGSAAVERAGERTAVEQAAVERAAGERTAVEQAAVERTAGEQTVAAPAQQPAATASAPPQTAATAPAQPAPAQPTTAGREAAAPAQPTTAQPAAAPPQQPSAATTTAAPPAPPQPPAASLPPAPVTPEPAVSDLMQRALEIEAQDPAGAALAYARAALRGRERAAYYLGQLQETGSPPDPGLARLWYAAAPELAAAQRRLRVLSVAEAPPGTPAAPVPAFQARLEGGASEMIWRVPGGVTPARFRVEMIGPDEQPLPAQMTKIPGLIAPVPVGAWRVIAIGANGTESPPSAMVRMTPDGQGESAAGR